MNTNKNLDWAMPFGSMVNSYGQVHQGEKLDTETFLADMVKLQAKAKTFAEGSKDTVPNLGNGRTYYPPKTSKPESTLNPDKIEFEEI